MIQLSGHEGRHARAEAVPERRPHVAKIAGRARAAGTGSLGRGPGARRDRGRAPDPRSGPRRRLRVSNSSPSSSPTQVRSSRPARHWSGRSVRSPCRSIDGRGAPRWPRLPLGVEIDERCVLRSVSSFDPKSPGWGSGGPVGFRFQLAQGRPATASARPRLRELLPQAIRLEIARRLEHLLRHSRRSPSGGSPTLPAPKAWRSDRPCATLISVSASAWARSSSSSMRTVCHGRVRPRCWVGTVSDLESILAGLTRPSARPPSRSEGRSRSWPARDRQDHHDHAPHRVPGPERRVRAVADPRGDVHRQGGR